MHDLDQTLDFAEEEFDEFDDEFYENETEPSVFEDEYLEFDDSDEDEEIDDGPLDDAVETELAAELLSAEDDEDLERVVKKAMRRRPPGRRPRRRRRRNRRRRKGVGGLLKRVAKVALPGVGAVLGGPVGAALGRAASKAISPEMEGLPPEDLDFETARAVVRTASDAADNAERIPDEVDDEKAANAAVVGAARKHAPRLVRRKRGARTQRPPRPAARASAAAGAQSGRWIRRGGKIVLLGL